MKKVVSSIAVAAGLTLGASAVHADMHPGVQGLNDLLIQKGIITKEEVEAQAKKHSLNITGYIQVQGAVIDNNDAKGTGTGAPALADEDGFRVRRAKLAVSGYAYEHVKFKIEGEFSGSAPKLEDSWIEDDRLPYFVGKVGQFKAPFGREYNTSATEILTIERSEVTNQITPGRDIGMMLSGKVVNNVLTYYVGAFNGAPAKAATTYSVGSYNSVGQNQTKNDNDQLLYVARFVIKAADWINVGVNGLTSQDGVGSSALGRTAYGVDLQLKNPKRGCSLQGEYLRQWLKKTSDNTDTSDGFYVLAGHYLVPKHLEAVVKYEEYDSNKDAANQDDIRWTTIGLNYYIYGHDAKLMANYILKDEKDGGYNNNTILTQLQLRF